MKPPTPPRLYCIPATRAPVVAVFRRGPSDWAHVGRWDLTAGRYEAGAWLRARIFPRRSDLSPDGRFLSYFAHDPKAEWEHGDSYVAVSRLPWLTALHACGTCGTWTRGYHFAEGRKPEGLPIPFFLQPTPAVQFAVERRRGWDEAPDSPPRIEGDMWDQRRNVRMLKAQPAGDRVLCVESVGWAGGEFGAAQAVDGLRVRYSLETDGDLLVLDDLQWADWDAEGRLLVATRSGRIQLRTLAGDGLDTVFDEDLCALEPDPAPSPDWARGW